MSFVFPSDFPKSILRKLNLTSLSVLCNKYSHRQKKNKMETQTETYIEKCLLFWHKHWNKLDMEQAEQSCKNCGSSTQVVNQEDVLRDYLIKWKSVIDT